MSQNKPMNDNENRLHRYQVFIEERKELLATAKEAAIRIRGTFVQSVLGVGRRS
jgi:hypothetical protein